MYPILDPILTFDLQVPSWKTSIPIVVYGETASVRAKGLQRRNVVFEADFTFNILTLDANIFRPFGKPNTYGLIPVNNSDGYMEEFIDAMRNWLATAAPTWLREAIELRIATREKDHTDAELREAQGKLTAAAEAHAKAQRRFDAAVAAYERACG